MAYTDIDKPSDFFKSKIWTGNGSSQDISLDFAPNWIWVKQRSSTRYHNLQDSIRGVGVQLFSNTTSADNADTSNITAFNSNGYSLGAGDNVNKNNSTYVGWSWKGGSSNSTNTSGDRDTTVSANQDAGFSIVSYTVSGTSAHTTGHGLSKAPELVLWKSRDRAASWSVYAKPIGNTKVLRLDTTAASATSGSWNDTTPTNTLVTHGGYYNGDKIIYYAFHSVDGYSKIGSYTGNGNADGTYVYTGFKPAFLMIKCTDAARSWQIHNSKSSPFNNGNNNARLFANLADAEATNSSLDLLSNGFKVREGDDLNTNGSGNAYIYMAFAEQPFVTSKGIPATAR